MTQDQVPALNAGFGNMHRYWLHIHSDNRRDIVRPRSSDVPFPAFAANNHIDLNGPHPGSWQIISVHHDLARQREPGGGPQVDIFHVHLIVKPA